MAYINFEIESFANPLPIGFSSPHHGQHRVTMGRAVWAATSIGYNPFGLRRHPHGHDLEMQWRQAMLRASLQPDGCHFVRTESFRDGLDQSEKGAVSFFLGQAQAKVFAHDFFKVSKFIHYDLYLSHLGRPVKGTRPDFLGCRKGFAIGVEVKGRTRYPHKGMMNDAKSQAQSLPALAGYPAPVTYVHAAHFHGGVWNAKLVDPPHESQTAIEVDPVRLTAAYYEPIVAAVERTQVRPGLAHFNDDVPYRRAYFEGTDVYVSVRSDISELLRADDEGIIRPADQPGRYRELYELAMTRDDHVAEQLADPSEEIDSEEVGDRPGMSFIGGDGIVVELGRSWYNWGTELFRRYQAFLA